MLQSHSEQIAEYTGEQLEQVLAQIAMENELKESLGLMPTVEQPSNSTSEPAQPDEPDDDEGAETQPARP
jgi:capsid protein